MQAGANMIVSGSAIVSSHDPKNVIDQLRSTVNKWLTTAKIPLTT